MPNVGRFDACLWATRVCLHRVGCADVLHTTAASRRGAVKVIRPATSHFAVVALLFSITGCATAATTTTVRRTQPPPRLVASLDDVSRLAAAATPLLKEHGYVLLGGLEDMTVEQMKALMGVISGPRHRMLRFDANSAPSVPEVRLLGRGHDGALLADIGYEWHQDGGGTAPFLTLLHCKFPCEGADTLFADGQALFDRLSREDQRRARALTAVYSNEFTAGGPTALDAACGLRMSPCGTRRVRSATRRKEGWEPGRFSRPLVETACADGAERLLAGAKGLERFEGMGPAESVDELARLLRAALGPEEEGEVDSDLRTIGETRFSEDAVYVHRWRRGDAILFDNHRLLHSTVPLSLYHEARRVMWQIICMTE